MNGLFKAGSIVIALVASWWLLPATAVNAEPWLANRYAQNCAGCHAPGRINLKPIDRRCTLACQGCHVSPQGGGLRSQYGKWTEDRWLRSFVVPQMGHYKSTATEKEQPYGNRYAQFLKKVKKNKKAKLKRKGKKIRQIYVKRGYLLKETDEVYPDETKYWRDGLEFVEAKSRDEWAIQLPMEDPWREIGRTKVDGGGDLRYQYQSRKIKSSTAAGKTSIEDWQSFFMVADMQLRWRPMHRKLHLVWEGRALQRPTDKKYPWLAANTTVKRSLYGLLEDLPFATYAQAGYYRPIFGSPSADHTLLTQRMISYALQDNPFNYLLHYEAYGFGGSPNVPFANINLITRQFGATGMDESNRGVVVNMGGRFVTLGASATYSYWRSSRDAPNGKDKTKIEMHAIGLAGQFAITTAQLELIAFNKDIPGDAFLSGGVYSLDTYTRMWREIYANFGYHFSNTAETLRPGSASQIRLGVRAFLIPGLDVSFGIRQESHATDKVDDKTQATETNMNAMTGQIHVYF